MARAPFLLIHVDLSEVVSPRFRCVLRDIDGSTDQLTTLSCLLPCIFASGTQEASRIYRYGFVADASTGPNVATQQTLVTSILPPPAGNQPEVQIRVMTADAVGADEWIGIDAIVIDGCTAIAMEPSNTSACAGGSANLSVTAADNQAMLYQWRRDYGHSYDQSGRTGRRRH